MGPLRCAAPAILALGACAGEIAVPCVVEGLEVTGDGRDNDCDGLVDEIRVCAAGGAQFGSIGDAIAAAPPGAGVEVCEGVYREVLAIDRSIYLQGAGAGATILDAGGAATVVTLAAGVDVTIEGFTIQGGDTEESGGGVRCAGAALRLLDSALAGNEAAERGGGLHAEDCTVEVTGTVVAGNDAELGGGISVRGGDVLIAGAEIRENLARLRGGGLYVESDATIRATTIAANRANWIGGGIYVDLHAPTFEGNTITGNVAEWEGGGAYLHNAPAVFLDNEITDNECWDDGGGLRIFESEVRLERNRIAGNRSTDGDGGGFKISHLPGLFVDNEIVDNSAYGAGGGVELDNDSSDLRGGVIARNRASVGGGVHVMLWPWNRGVIEDVRIADNDAWLGGGIYLEDNFDPVLVRRVTIEGNDAHQGGGLYATGTPLVLRNALVVGNDADEGGGVYLAPSEPWTGECPCPPVNPPVDLDFVVVHGNTADDAGAALWTSAPGVSVDSSILSAHQGAAVVLRAPGTLAWRYNDTFPPAFDGLADPTGAHGNLSTEPQFAAAASGDFRLLDASACIDAGNPDYTDRDGSRADMGLYAGPEAP